MVHTGQYIRSRKWKISATAFMWIKQSLLEQEIFQLKEWHAGEQEHAVGSFFWRCVLMRKHERNRLIFFFNGYFPVTNRGQIWNFIWCWRSKYIYLLLAMSQQCRSAFQWPLLLCKKILLLTANRSKEIIIQSRQKALIWQINLIVGIH